MKQEATVSYDVGEKLLVGSVAQLFERRKIRRTVAATNTAPQEGFDSLLIGRIG